MANADVTWIDVLPSAKNFLPNLNAAVQPAARSAGEQAGRSFGTSFGASSTNAVEAASTKMSAALRKVEDAAGRVRVAETSLEQVRNNSKSTATQIVTAEERLATARRNETAANENLNVATRRVSDAQTQHTQAVRNGNVAMDEGTQKAGLLSRTFGSMHGAVIAGFAAFEGARVAVDFIGGAVGAARDLNETVNKSSVIFGSNAGVVDNWAKGAARSVGLSRAAALESAAGFGNMYTQLGFTGKAAADMSIKTVQMAADLGSFNNLPTADVAEMISGAFRGEYDSLQQLIPTISDASVKAEAMAETGKTNADSLTAQEKATAVLAIIQRDGNKAMGDFARTSGGLANQQKILAAQWDDSKAKLGQLLVGPLTGIVSFISQKAMPVFNNFIDQIPNLGGAIKDLDSQGVGEVLDNIFGNTGRLVDPFRTVSDLLFNSVVPAFRGLWGVAVQLAPAIGTGLVTGAGLALNLFVAFAPVLQSVAGFLSDNRWAVVALVGAYSAWKLATLANNAVLLVQNGLLAVSAAGGIGGWLTKLPIVTVATRAWAAAQWLLNAAMSANPFVLIGIAIAALVAGIILAYQHSETFRAIVDAAFRAVAEAGRFMWENVLKPAWTALLAYWGLLWQAVQFAWNNVYGPAFRGIGALAVWLWENVLRPTWAGMQTAWAAISGAISSGVALIQFAWNNLGTALSFVWNSIIRPAWDAMVLAGKVLALVIGTLVIAPIMIAWNLMSAAIQAAWTGIISPTFQAFAALGQWLWNTILLPTWNAMQAGWNFLAGVIRSVYQTVIAVTWQAMQAAASFLWNSVLLPIWNAMQATWAAVLNAMNFVWNTVLHPAWVAIQVAMQFLWNSVLLPLWTAMQQTWAAIVNAMVFVWNSILHPMWLALEAAMRFLWSVLQSIWTIMGQTWTALLNGMQAVWNGVLLPTWRALQAAAEFLWNSVLTPIWRAMGATWDALMRGMRSLYDGVLHPMWGILSAGVDSARRAFDAAVAGIRIVWDSLMDITATPINFVLEVVFNRGLFTAWNWLVDHLALNANWKAPHWDQLSRGQHFAEGGRVAGFSPHSKSDNIDAKLTAGEFVEPVDVVRHYGLGPMEAIRQKKAAIYYDGGGLVPGLATGGQIFAFTQAHFPRAKLNSSYRPGANDYHGSNQAADMGEAGFAGGAGRQYLADIKRWWVDNYGRTTAEIIYTGIGNDRPNIKNGGAYNYSPAVNAQHTNHVHVAYLGNLPGAPTGAGAAGGAGGAPAPIEPPWYVKMWGSIAGATTWFADSIKSVGEMVGRFGNSDYVQMIKEIPGKAMGAMWEKVKGTLTGLFDSWTAQQSAAVAAGNAGAPILGGPAQGQVQAVFNERGWGSGAQWNAASWIIGKESGWNPRAQNPVSSASGLFQFIDGTWAAYRPPAAAGIAHAKDAAVNQQAIAGARYIAARYGDPIAAQRYWQAHGNYAQGGLVSDLFDRGGIWRHGRVGLNLSGGDERVLTAPQDDYFRRFVAATEDMVDRGRGRSAPLIGSVVQQPGESTEVFVDRLWHKLRVADRGGVHVGGGGLL